MRKPVSYPLKTISTLHASVSAALLLLALSPVTGGTAAADSPSNVVTENTSLEQGSVCTGYNPEKKAWGWSGHSDGAWIKCPPHAAFPGVAKPPDHLFAKSILIFANCCPLPSPDILTTEHITVEKQCPDGFIATGLEVRGCPKEDSGKKCIRSLRCTAINTSRYSLGAVHHGVHWGVSTASSFPWRERKRIRQDELPPAIRYGISRITRVEFSENGCVGDPVGSLFVGKTDTTCGGTLWRQLFHKREKGDPLNGTPVEMFPKCIRIENVLSTHLTCIKKEQFFQDQHEDTK